jgi:hypothetical protein
MAKLIGLFEERQRMWAIADEYQGLAEQAEGRCKH